MAIARASARAYNPQAERIFFTTMTAAILAAVVVGFGRTFFFRAWFGDYAAAHSPAEPFFYFHGAFFAAWFGLLLLQAGLVNSGRIDLHRKLGICGAVLAAVMVVLGIAGAVIAASRPTGFVDVPVPPHIFIVEPLAAVTLFAVFVGLGIARRRDSASHKRLMLLGSIAMIAAAISRWPTPLVHAPSPIPIFQTPDLLLDLFLLPLIFHDLLTRGRLHPVTLWGTVVLLVSQPARWMLASTDTFQAFAAWLTS